MLSLPPSYTTNNDDLKKTVSVTGIKLLLLFLGNKISFKADLESSPPDWKR